MPAPAWTLACAPTPVWPSPSCRRGRGTGGALRPETQKSAASEAGGCAEGGRAAPGSLALEGLASAGTGGRSQVIVFSL